MLRGGWERIFCNRRGRGVIWPDERQYRRALETETHSTQTRIIMKASLILLVIGLSLGSASARDFGRSTSTITGRGTASRSVAGSVTPGAGLTRGATTTGAKGRTAATTRQIVRNADGSGRTSGGTVTGPNGQTATTSGSVTRAEGVRTAVRSVTTPAGQTKSVTNTTTKN